MLYSRLFAPWLLWLAYMLTLTETQRAAAFPSHNCTEECLHGGRSSPSTTTRSLDRICDGLIARAQQQKQHPEAEEEEAEAAEEVLLLRLETCGRPLLNALAEPRPHDRSHCLASLRHVTQTDSTARSWINSFRHLLQRYDCTQPYSVNFNCEHCLDTDDGGMPKPV